MSTSTILILLGIGIFAGILSGMIGVGGGIVIVPALIYFLGLTQMEAQGTSIALMLPPIGVLAAMNYQKTGNLEWKYAMIIAITFVIGGYIGSKISLSIPQEIVKKIFASIMMIVAIKMMFFSK
jgi:uncharacterized membrane protein YfcA